MTRRFNVNQNRVCDNGREIGDLFTGTRLETTQPHPRNRSSISSPDKYKTGESSELAEGLC